MTRYYGSMDSNRRKTEATCNGPVYGHVRGWDAGVKVIPDWSAPKNQDELAVYMTGGSSGSSPTRLVGTVRETPDGPRWIPAEAPGRVPARVGSPTMEVVAAIPVGAHKDNPEPDEYICAVHTRTASYGDRRSYFGTVHAYRQPDGRWSADAGNYELSQTAAVHDMIARAGCERPPAVSEDEAGQVRDLLAAIERDAAQEVVWPDDVAQLAVLVRGILDRAARGTS